MAEQTGISWADSTANLWRGCQKVSAACDNCYAETLVCGRMMGDWGPHAARVLIKAGWDLLRKFQRIAEANGGIDPKLGRQRRIFINSLSDFFDNHESVIWRDDAWQAIRQCPDLIIMIVTKRPQNIRKMLPEFWNEIAGRVWLIVTAEDQVEFNRRMLSMSEQFVGLYWPAVRGVSIEPLLAPINIRGWMQFLDWVIVGGESGKNARPLHPHWIEDIQEPCADAGIAFHFKQWGEWAPGENSSGPQKRTERAAWINEDGTWHFEEITVRISQEMHVDDEPDVWRIGKKRTGRLLNGVLYDEFPA